MTTVKAEDRDITASITYEIISGDQNLFTIDPESGVIRTLKGLDYEKQRMHFITVSTTEARGTFDLDRTSTVVAVEVQDTNDIPPMFINVPRSVQVRNDAEIGAKIALVKATDSDGTEPGNVVGYELSENDSSEKALEYFAINPDTGEVEVIGDLTQEVFDNYKVKCTKMCYYLFFFL